MTVWTPLDAVPSVSRTQRPAWLRGPPEPGRPTRQAERITLPDGTTMDGFHRSSGKTLYVPAYGEWWAIPIFHPRACSLSKNGTDLRRWIDAPKCEECGEHQALTQPRTYACRDCHEPTWHNERYEADYETGEVKPS